MTIEDDFYEAAERQRREQCSEEVREAHFRYLAANGASEARLSTYRHRALRLAQQVATDDMPGVNEWCD